MGKTPQRARKYGMPVYAAAWPAGNTVYLAGGGGHGIKHRLVAVQVEGEQLSDEVAQLPLEDVPYRMAAHPGGKCLAVALSSGKVVRVNISSGAEGGDAPTIALATGEEALALAKAHSGKVVALGFSSDGRLLALGGEDGSLTVLQWPTLRVRASITGDKGLPDGVKDVDFSRGHQHRVLAATCEDGSCTLWEWERAIQLIKLDLPEALKRGSFNRVRFARDGSLGIYTAVNAAGKGHVLHWLQDDAGEVALKGRDSPVDGAITAFEMSGDGRTLGLGTSEGEAALLAAPALKRLRRERQAHMVFATAATMAPDGGSLLTGSADASVCVTAAGRRQRSPARSLLIPLLLLLLAVLAYYVHVSLRWRGSQRIVQELNTPYDNEL